MDMFPVFAILTKDSFHSMNKVPILEHHHDTVYVYKKSSHNWIDDKIILNNIQEIHLLDEIFSSTS